VPQNPVHNPVSEATGNPGPAPQPGQAPAVTVRDARPAELAEIGDLRVTAYEAGGFLSDASHYGETLRTLGNDGSGQILVAVGNQGEGSETPRILGTVMLQLPPHAGHVVRGPDEAEIRALAVAPEARGRGVGRVLLRAVADRARACGVRHLLLSTQMTMLAAQHLYVEAGFRRLPERDWDPVPGFTLLAYGVELSS
jgi:ribosomal protein S18 acetylase RimI-like enzyme